MSIPDRLPKHSSSPAGSADFSSPSDSSSKRDVLRRIQKQMSKPENQSCCDCSASKPTWVSIIVVPNDASITSIDSKVGAFCCYHCAIAHRALGTHITFVRSIGLDNITERDVLAMEYGGNKAVNLFFEAELPDKIIRPSATDNMAAREQFIRLKYESKRFCLINDQQADKPRSVRGIPLLDHKKPPQPNPQQQTNRSTGVNEQKHQHQTLISSTDDESELKKHIDEMNKGPLIYTVSQDDVSELTEEVYSHSSSTQSSPRKHKKSAIKRLFKMAKRFPSKKASAKDYKQQENAITKTQDSAKSCLDGGSEMDRGTMGTVQEDRVTDPQHRQKHKSKPPQKQQTSADGISGLNNAAIRNNDSNVDYVDGKKKKGGASKESKSLHSDANNSSWYEAEYFDGYNHSSSQQLLSRRRASMSNVPSPSTVPKTPLQSRSRSGSPAVNDGSMQGEAHVGRRSPTPTVSQDYIEHQRHSYNDVVDHFTESINRSTQQRRSSTGAGGTSHRTRSRSSKANRSRSKRGHKQDQLGRATFHGRSSHRSSQTKKSSKTGKPHSVDVRGRERRRATMSMVSDYEQTKIEKQKRQAQQNVYSGTRSESPARPAIAMTANPHFAVVHDLRWDDKHQTDSIKRSMKNRRASMSDAHHISVSVSTAPKQSSNAMSAFLDDLLGPSGAKLGTQSASKLAALISSNSVPSLVNHDGDNASSVGTPDTLNPRQLRIATKKQQRSLNAFLPVTTSMSSNDSPDDMSMDSDILSIDENDCRAHDGKTSTGSSRRKYSNNMYHRHGRPSRLGATEDRAKEMIIMEDIAESTNLVSTPITKGLLSSRSNSMEDFENGIGDDEMHMQKTSIQSLPNIPF